MNDLSRTPAFPALAGRDPMALVAELDATILVGGERLRVAASLDVIAPATGRLLGAAAACGTAETDRAVTAARGAFDTWRAVPARTRGKRVAAAGRARKRPL